MRPHAIALESEDCRWRCVVAPEAGGGCLELQVRSLPGWIDIGRPSPSTGPAARDPFEFASFPLVPYSNRIADGKVLALRHGGPVQVPRNHADFVHPLHGTGWLRRWEIGSLSARSVSLHLAEPACADWPWAFEAEQQIAIEDNTIRFELHLACRGDGEMPAGIGWHPYFVRDPDTQIRLRVGARDEADSTGLPTTRTPVGSRWPQTLVGLDAFDGFDNGLIDWEGMSELRWPSRGVGVTLQTGSTTGRYCVLYTPPGAAFFCLEPVSHGNNALGMTPETAARNGQRWLAHGESLGCSMSLTAFDLAGTSR